MICSYLFLPLSVIMGVDWEDSREMAKLIGIKVFTSEIIAYQELGRSIDAGRLSVSGGLNLTASLAEVEDG